MGISFSLLKLKKGVRPMNLQSTFFAHGLSENPRISAWCQLQKSELRFSVIMEPAGGSRQETPQPPQRTKHLNSLLKSH